MESNLFLSLNKKYFAKKKSVVWKVCVEGRIFILGPHELKKKFVPIVLFRTKVMFQ